MILMFDKKSWINGILRELFGGIDSLLYSLVSWIIEGIFNLANVTANGDLVVKIYNRVYAILAIYMVFKLTFSFLKYLVSPDRMKDKEQGVGKLVGRTLTMIVIIVALPIIFFNYKLNIGGQQKTLLNAAQDGVMQLIPKIILGVEDDQASSAKEAGESMALMMLQNFYKPMACKADPVNCDNSKVFNTFTDFSNSLTNHSNGSYDYYYMWPLSTVVGVIMVILLLGLSVDVAIRIFKLIALQMIAPIPVMSYMDPKSSKDGGAFSSWVKNFISTYTSIFISLAILYFVLLLITYLMNGKLFGGSWTDPNVKGLSKVYLTVFMVIGLLKFAKDAPKFLKESLGIKDKGGSSFMGQAAGGLAGSAAGFAGGLAGGGGLAGAMAGASGGFKAGAEGSATGKKANVFAQTRDAQAKALGKQQGGLLGKAQTAANKNALAKMGISQGRRDQAERNMFYHQGQMEAAERRMQEAAGRGDTAAYNAAQTDYEEAQGNFVAAQKAFNIQDKALEAAGAKPGTYDKYHRGIGSRAGYAARRTYSTVRHPLETAKQAARDAGAHISNTVLDTLHVRNGGTRYTDRRYNKIAADAAGNKAVTGPGYGDNKPIVKPANNKDARNVVNEEP